MTKNIAGAYLDWEGKGFSFFCNTNCEYFPCHPLKGLAAGEFNCLFCYCPLYDDKNCGGTFTILANGCKDCSACTFPHIKANYGRMITRLREKQARHGG